MTELNTTRSHGGSVCHVTLPGGAWNRAVVDELVALGSELTEDRRTRVITVRSDGPVFCSGPDDDLDPLAVDPDPAAVWSALRPPVVVAVESACLSIGLEFVLAADIRIGAPSARFGFPDLAAGRLPCWGGTQRLSRAIRPAEATSMLLLGTELDAARAGDLGLIHQVTDDVGATIDQLVDELVARGPLALELAKEAVHRGAELPLRDGLRMEGDLNHQLAATDDRAEGLAAFFDKRPPDFAGR